MSIVQLRYFLAVCKHGSFANAAKYMNVSQPAISQAIRDIESEYKVRLFNRINNRLGITEDGKWLQKKAENLLQAADEMDAELHARSKNKRYVRVGVAPMVGNIYLYPLLMQMSKNNVDTIPDVREAGSLEIRRWLGNDSIDIAFCLLDCLKTDDFVTQKLLDAELKFCVHKTHPLAQRKVLTYADIAKHRICMLREDSYQNELLKKKFAQAGVDVDVTLYSSQLNTLFTMLSFGDCGTFLFDGLIKDNDSFVTIPLRNPITLSVGLVWNSHQQLDLHVEKFRKYVASHINVK